MPPRESQDQITPTWPLSFVLRKMYQSLLCLYQSSNGCVEETHECLASMKTFSKLQVGGWGHPTWCCLQNQSDQKYSHAKINVNAVTCVDKIHVHTFVVAHLYGHDALRMRRRKGRKTAETAVVKPDSSIRVPNQVYGKAATQKASYPHY